MIAKEWRDARWKLLVAVVAAVFLIFLMPSYEELVAEAIKYQPNVNPTKYALRDLNALYYVGGFFVLLPLAAVLGVTSISAEVSNGTILLLLSRPLSRVRLVLTKYVVGASILLIVAVLGKLLLVVAGAVQGYPVRQIDAIDTTASVLVLWLGVLFVLGTALLVSTVFRTVTASIMACALVLISVFALPTIIPELYPWGNLYNLATRLTLLTYWIPTRYYYADYLYGFGGFALTNFVVCLTAAAIPLLATLWLFNRRAY